MNSEDFSVRPFAAGVVVGLRSFRVLPEGHLTAVVKESPWHPGENLAKCFRYWPSMEVTEGVDHRVANADCTCGFYAYFDGGNDYGSARTITGVVEGYGTVTVGSRGFRAAKARIVAIVADYARADLVAANYPDVPVYPTLELALAKHPLTKPEDVGITPHERPTRPTLAPGGMVIGSGMTYFGGAHHVHFTIDATAMQQALQRAAANIRQVGEAMDKLRFKPGGIGPSWSEQAKPQTPVERKRAAAEAAAARRAQAGLSNLGGIDRRKRRL